MTLVMINIADFYSYRSKSFEFKQKFNEITGAYVKKLTDLKWLET